MAQLGTAGLAVTSLRDVEPEDLETARDALSEIILKRARHVVTENARVLQAVEALRAGDLSRFGQLMNESHDSLRNDYGVSSEALDALVNAARAETGCLGSRLTGAGFGGCTVSLVRQDVVSAFQNNVAHKYHQETGLTAEFYVTRPAAGAGRVGAVE